jgi:hypothetical protein
MLFAAAALSLLAGLLIYALFRNSSALVFSVMGKPAFLEPLRRRYLPHNPLGYFLVYNVPDGLWLLSGILCLRALWLDQGAKGAVYVRVFGMLAVLYEVLQCLDRVPGTFDPLDLFALVIAAFGEGVCYIYFIQRSINHAW